MLFYYWKRHGILPSVLFNLPIGEKLVIRAFYEQEIEDTQKVVKTGKVFPVFDVANAL
jgi:hypothetical protein